MGAYLLKYKGRLAAAVVMVTLASMLNVGTAFVFKGITEAITGAGKQSFKQAACIALAFIVFGAVVHFVSEWSKSAYMKRTMVHLKNDVFHKIMGKSMTEFSGERSAKYLSLINNDIKMLEEDFFRNIFLLIGTAVAFVSSLVSLFFLSYQIAAVLIVMALLSIAIPRIFEKRLSGSKSRFAESLELFMIKVNDLFSGFQVIKSFKIEKKIEEEYVRVNEEAEGRKFRFNIETAGVDAVSEIFGGLMFISTFLIGGLLTIQGNVTFGVMIACVQLTNSVVNPIFASVQYLTRIKSLKHISGKIAGMLAREEEARAYTPKDQFTSEMVLEGVSFGYDRSRQVLKEIDLTIHKNQKVALVGASGSGKSTLLKLLQKQYENYDGSIRVDGIPLKDISAEDLAQFQSILHQSTFLFDSSILENIRLFGPYTEEEVAKAAELAGMSAFLSKLPVGLASPVGENGSLLSGGEKQRVAIARTLLRKAPILMMDEATSALDNETAYAIEETILSMQEITAVTVTHRLVKSLLERYDCIYVLQEGRIIEQGRFQELMDLKGYFYSLYSIENKAFQPAIASKALLNS
ncbi:ABC transporter ATP-binding protein [Paenibacillus caui]|uniref:ABC transporter ATP-binding protein n=1 Tax=Paenibacillus caui TaxID=2873927 RepID=UPI001CA9F6D5|nr:ABC transporter ATP-binding protein [Paenibacillus caui]